MESQKDVEAAPNLNAEAVVAAHDSDINSPAVVRRPKFLPSLAGLARVWLGAHPLLYQMLALFAMAPRSVICKTHYLASLIDTGLSKAILKQFK